MTATRTAAPRGTDIDANAAIGRGADSPSPRRAAALLQTSRRVSVRTPWWHVLGAGAAVALGVSRLHVDEWATVDSVSAALRIGAMALAASVAFTFDDPTEPTLAGTPVGQWARRTLKLLAMLLVLAAVWIGILVYAEATPAINTSPGTWTETGLIPGGPIDKPVSGWWLPVGALSIELAAMTTLVLLGAAWGSKLAADRSGGLVGVATLLVAILLISMLPARWLMLAAPAHGEDVWRDAHLRWAWLGGVAFVLALLGNRDPGRHSLLRRRHTAVPTPGTTRTSEA